MTSDRISVRRDDELSDALSLLAQHGWSVSDAVRYAVGILADAQHEALMRGVTVPGQRVDIVHAGIRPAP